MVINFQSAQDWMELVSWLFLNLFKILKKKRVVFIGIYYRYIYFWVDKL